MHSRNSFVVFAALLFLSNVVGGQEANPMKATPDPDGKTLWFDGKEFALEGKGWNDTELFYDRLPAKAKGKVPGNVWGLGRNSAGLCVRFTTDAGSIKVRWTLTDTGIKMGGSVLATPHQPATGVSGIDVYSKNSEGQWQFINNGRPLDIENTRGFDPIRGSETLLYLPLYNGVKSLKIGIPKDNKISSVTRLKDSKPIVFYGTSITQGGCASRPGMAYTAIVGRRLDRPVINLGFSGCGRMEIEMAELIGELDPVVFVLDCLWNMDGKMMQERMEPFVRKLRELRPLTPILLMDKSSFLKSARPPKGNASWFNQLTAAGLTNIHYLSSENMLGDDSEGTVDGVHPNDLGMMRMAEAVIPSLRPIIQGQK